jgi:hypothetical protein
VSVDGEFSFKWYYSLNDIKNNDLVEIEIRPYPVFEIYGETHGKSYRVSSDGNLFNYEEIDFDGLAYDDSVTLFGDTLLFNGVDIRDDLSSPSYVSTFLFNGSLRILVADTGNSRVIELDTTGVTINVMSFTSPVFCEYSSGSIFVTDNVDLNVVEVSWKDEDLSLETAGSFGSILWDYNVEYPLDPLAEPKSATKSFDKDVVYICDGGLIKIDRETEEIELFESFRFKNPVGDSVDNSLLPPNIIAYYDIGSNTELSIQSESDLLEFTTTDHEALNRSLGENALVNKQKGLWNNFGYPILPPVADETNLTFTVINTDSLVKKSVENVFFDKISDSLNRGNIDSLSVWGIQESYNGSVGGQTLVSMTGMDLNCLIPYIGVKRGFSASGEDLEHVYVREFALARLVNVSDGDSNEVLPFTEINQDVGFSFRLPDATEESYSRSQTYGSHYVVNLELEITEYYYSDEDFEDETLPRSTNIYHYPIHLFWWRQTFKEITGIYNPVVEDFDLFDYNESPEIFYERTLFPSFSKVVGTEVLSPSSGEKRAIVYDNAMGMLSFNVGYVPGDSPRSNLFSLNPLSYTKERVTNTLDREDFTSFEFSKSRLFGLNADYQNSNITDDFLEVSASNTAYLADFPYFSSYRNGSFVNLLGESGLLINPFLQKVNNIKINMPNGVVNERLEFDSVDLVVSNISVASGAINSEVLINGEENVVVRFSTDDSPTVVSIAISIDGSPFMVVNDSTGLLREYIFSTPVLVTGQFVDAIVVLGDGVSSVGYSKMERVVSTNDTSSIGNIRVQRNKVGKTLKVLYDVFADRDYLPLNISMTLSDVSGEIDVSKYFYGDLGDILSGSEKRVLFNYGQYLTTDQIRSKITLDLTVTSVDGSTIVGDSSASFFIEIPDLHEHDLNKDITIDIFEDVLPSIQLINRTNVKDVSFDNLIPDGQYLYDISSSSSSSLSSSSYSSSSYSSSS